MHSEDAGFNPPRHLDPDKEFDDYVTQFLQVGSLDIDFGLSSGLKDVHDFFDGDDPVYAFIMSPAKEAFPPTDEDTPDNNPLMYLPGYQYQERIDQLAALVTGYLPEIEVIPVRYEAQDWNSNQGERRLSESARGKILFEYNPFGQTPQGPNLIARLVIENKVIWTLTDNLAQSHVENRATDHEHSDVPCSNSSFYEQEVSIESNWKSFYALAN